jgi:RimJ/RimL family protein N-acetyltransferase
MLGPVSNPGGDDFRRITPPLEGRLIRLRAVEGSDLARISELFNDPDVLFFLDQVVFPQAPSGTRDWWLSARSQPGQQLFAIETRAGELIGVCDLRAVNDRSRWAELGIWVAKPYWGQGYGTDAVRTVCRFGFREMNLQRVELHVHATNPRGIRAYEKVGFKEEGRLRRSHFVGGTYVDTLVMGLLHDELLEE